MATVTRNELLSSFSSSPSSSASLSSSSSSSSSLPFSSASSAFSPTLTASQELRVHTSRRKAANPYRNSSVRFTDLLLNLLPFSNFHVNFFRNIEAIEILATLAKTGFSFGGLRVDEQTSLRCFFCGASPMMLSQLSDIFHQVNEETRGSRHLLPRVRIDRRNNDDRHANSFVASVLQLFSSLHWRRGIRRGSLAAELNDNALRCHAIDCRRAALNVDDLTLAVKLDGLYYVYRLIDQISSLLVNRVTSSPSASSSLLSFSLSPFSLSRSSSSAAAASSSSVSSSLSSSIGSSSVQLPCKICFSENSVALVPCGHVYSCQTCWLTIEGSRCPVCRCYVTFAQHLYF